MQLMELAILNGTYRDSKAIPLAHAFGLPWNAQLQTMQMLGQFDTSGLDHKSILKTSDYQFSEAPRFLTAASPLTAGISQLRSPTPAGAPLILAPRMPQVATSSATMINPPPLVSPTDSAATGLMYNPYEYPYSLQPAATLVEYPTSIEQTAAGAVPKIRRTLDTVRTHPYTRVALP
nr:protein quaking-B-like isoform X6 [Crassostrea gigas]